MARERRVIEIVCSVSENDAAQDGVDDAAFEKLKKEIKGIADKHDYTTISPQVSGN